MGDYCPKACEAIITCIKANPGCGTAADPMCVKRGASSGTANVCTGQWESGSGTPSQAATAVFTCACGVSVPGTGGASGTGGAKSTGGATGTGGKASTGGTTGTGGKGN
jgi:hypothetical protein